MKYLVSVSCLLLVFVCTTTFSQTVRVYNKEKYIIMNPNEKIVLYKLLTASSIKGSKPIFEFFFSKDSMAPVLPLNFMELNAAYTENTAFLELLDVYFKNKEELTTFDLRNKIYKINRIFDLSTNINRQLVLIH